MPEVTIKYKKPETLKILKGLAKYFDFKVSSSKDKKAVTKEESAAVLNNGGGKPYKIKGVTIIPGRATIDNDDVTDLFDGVDAAKLRKEAWQRKQ